MAIQTLKGYTRISITDLRIPVNRVQISHHAGVIATFEVPKYYVFTREIGIGVQVSKLHVQRWVIGGRYNSGIYDKVNSNVRVTYKNKIKHPIKRIEHSVHLS